VYITVRCPSCLSVHLSSRPTAATAGSLLSSLRAGDTDLQLLQAPALSSKRGSVMLRADGGGLVLSVPPLSVCGVRQLPHLTRHYTVLALVLVSLFIALGSVLC